MNRSAPPVRRFGSHGEYVGVGPPNEQLETAWSVLDLFLLDGRVAIVTGGSSGLGVAFARALAEAAADVALAARRADRLEDTQAGLDVPMQRDRPSRRELSGAARPCPPSAAGGR